MASPLKPPLFPFIAEHDVIWYGIALQLVQVIGPAVSPPSLLHTLRSIHWEGRVTNGEGLDAVQPLLSKS